MEHHNRPQVVANWTSKWHRLIKSRCRPLVLQRSGLRGGWCSFVIIPWLFMFLFPHSNGEGFLQGDELKGSNIPQSAWSCVTNSRGYDGSKLKFPHTLVVEWNWKGLVTSWKTLSAEAQLEHESWTMPTQQASKTTVQEPCLGTALVPGGGAVPWQWKPCSPKKVHLTSSHYINLQYSSITNIMKTYEN